MIWRDLLYFSSGEKRALVILIGLILSATAVLTLCSRQKEMPEQEVSLLQEEHSRFPSGLPAKTSAATHTGSLPEKLKSLPPSSAKEKRYKGYTSDKPSSETHTPASYPVSSKYQKGTRIELNSADTTSLKKIPSIGSVFANRIVKFRKLLGGFYSIEQLKEVYGMTEEKYTGLYPWFTTDLSLVNKLQVNTLPKDSLNRHPYLNYQQTRILIQLREQKGKLSGWNDLLLLEEFSETDKKRLSHYLSFE